MKKGVIISFILIIFLFSIVSAAFTIDDSGDLQERDSQEAEGETYPTYEPEDVVEEVEGATYDDEGYNFEEVTDEEFETNFEADDTITTSQGSMADFSMTNALFSLGSLVQGSFVSFEKMTQANRAETSDFRFQISNFEIRQIAFLMTCQQHKKRLNQKKYLIK